MFGTLNLSSPLLHMSKLASCLELKTAKTLLFGLFAAVFFVTRVLMFPYFILKWCVQLAGQHQRAQWQPAQEQLITSKLWHCSTAAATAAVHAL